MRVVAWNLNRRKDPTQIWAKLEAMAPDIVLLSEVNKLPSAAGAWSGSIEVATGPTRQPRKFSTALLTRYAVTSDVPLISKHAWVNEALAAFPGNLVARRLVTPRGTVLNVISLHMPS